MPKFSVTVERSISYRVTVAAPTARQAAVVGETRVEEEHSRALVVGERFEAVEIIFLDAYIEPDIPE